MRELCQGDPLTIILKLNVACAASPIFWWKNSAKVDKIGKEVMKPIFVGLYPPNKKVIRNAVVTELQFPTSILLMFFTWSEL